MCVYLFNYLDGSKIHKRFHFQRDQVANLATVGYPLYYSAPAVAALWELFYASNLSDLSWLRSWMRLYIYIEIHTVG